MELRLLIRWPWRDCHTLSLLTQFNPKHALSMDERAENSTTMWCNVTNIWLTITSFEYGRQLLVKNFGQFLETGKDKEINFSLESPERNTTLPKPWF